MRNLLLLGLLLWGSAGAVTYTETQRLKIWGELSAADAKAARAADATYPETCSSSAAQMSRHAALSDRLAEQWQQAIAKKYKLTHKQLSDLLFEGYDKNWPEAVYPPRSCQ